MPAYCLGYREFNRIKPFLINKRKKRKQNNQITMLFAQKMLLKLPEISKNKP